jgi:hypothetical protein
MTDPSAHSQPDSHPQSVSAPRAAEPSPLEQIVDDYEPRLEAFDLAVAALQTGSTFEQVKSRLMAIGWADSDAEEILEEARIHTREMRGVVTRDQVLRHAHRRFSFVEAIRRVVAPLTNLLFFRHNGPER